MTIILLDIQEGTGPSTKQSSMPHGKEWITGLQTYVKEYTTCQQNKILTHKRKTTLYKISTKEHTLPFQQITMDLITGLLPFKGKDATSPIPIATNIPVSAATTTAPSTLNPHVQLLHWCLQW